MGKFVGIDLGTTYSVVAYINAQGKAEVIPNEFGHTVTPSVVYFGGGIPIVGDEAKEQQEAGETEIAAFFKRNMDDSQFGLTSYGRKYTAVDLSALVLSYMKKQAENFFGEPVTDAVITVPAYFEHNQRSATLAAGQQAGLNVLKIISEPTAAALAYGLRPTSQTAEQMVLVYDLGGGTFDISLVSITPTDLVVIATDGDHNLGGKDWDDQLIFYLSTEFAREYGVEMSTLEVNLLRVQTEKLKRSLSTMQSADIRVQAAGHSRTYTITRAQFQDLTRDLMGRTQAKTEQVLAEAGKMWGDLSGILPVGGSTKMPMVTDYIKRMSGKTPMGGINPDEAVALGAAIQAAMERETLTRTGVPDLRLAGRKRMVDVIAHSLGLIAENADRSRYLNSIIIRKNLSIPSQQMRPYQMGLRRNIKRTELEVFLTQSESDDPQKCVYLGRYVFSDFPRNIASKTVVLDITYEYDKNGIVHISAVERSTGKPLKLNVYPVPPDVPERFIGPPRDHEVREPVYVYLAFDVSGSMYVKRKRVIPLNEAKQAAEKFVNNCDMSMTSIGLIAFSDRVHIEQEATNSNKAITQAIQRLPTVKTGTSNNADPFDDILYLLGDVQGARYAIVLADGVWIHQAEAIRKAERCHEEGIEVIAVGFGSADRDFLSRIASSPEQMFLTDLSRLGETFTTIARELLESGGELRLGGKTR